MKVRLSIGVKLAISNLVFIVPILVLLNLYIRSVGDNIQFAESELLGNTYQRPLMSLLYHMGQHRAVSHRALHGDEKSRQLLQGIENDINAGVQQLESVQARIGVDLQFTPEGLGKRKREHYSVNTLKDEWSKLQGELSSLSVDVSNDRHAHLIGDIRNMITHAGDTSNLILDPDLDSYYLMDGTLVAIPQMMDRIQDILVSGEKPLRQRSLNEEDRIKIAVFSALLKQSDLDRLTGDLQTALSEDANFYGISASLQSNFPKWNAEVSAGVESLIKMLNDSARGIGFAPSADVFVSATENSLNITYNMWKGCVDELDVLLKKRIEVFTNKRNMSLLVSLLAVLLAISTASILGISIKRGVLDGISGAVKRIRAVSSNIDSSSKSMVQTSLSLSSASNQQASALQETASTLNQIDAMVQKTAGTAVKSSAEVSRAVDAANIGRAALNEVIEAITKIQSDNKVIMETVNESNLRILDIVRVVQEITSKTRVIHDIVFQTKLLSFNASVEAARAGESGKGFAVVAEEVGNLARMSGNSAKEISEMLGHSVTKVNSIVEENKRSIELILNAAVKRVDEGLIISKRCMEVFNDISVKIGGVNQLISGVSNAATEQATGVNEITKAIQEMDKTTHENTMSSQKTAQFAEELSSHAAALKEVVGDLERRAAA